MLTSGDERQIVNLLHRYAELVDAADFDGISELFANAPVFMAGPEQPAVPGSMVGAVMKRFVKLHDGSPLTRHVITNTVLEADTDSRVRTRSVFTVLQGVSGVLPLQVVASGRYHDVFGRDAEGRWSFLERTMLVDHHGDVSQHLHSLGGEKP
jgi:3-phenylpropionate/cinnamic acid dioxygenase small subunit